MILLIDNYDSFSHNLARYCTLAGWDDVRVIRNDEITVDEIHALSPKAIVISPGPCTPNEAGICLETVRGFGKETPILGVCLGHQVIAQAYGASVVRGSPVHGMASIITHSAEGIFEGIDMPMRVGRYHSLLIKHDSDLPFSATAQTAQGEVMAIQHKTNPVYGVQFHPESILTTDGLSIIKNFKNIAQKWYKKS